MKEFELNKLCDILHVNPVSDKPIIIKQVKTSVIDIDSDTVVFHLHKTHSLNHKRLNRLENCYIITDQPLLKKYRYLSNRFIQVLNIEKAYDAFIDYFRKQFKIKTIAITGTCGKTTTKEMVKQILGKNFQVTGTILSKNSLRFNHEYLMDIDETKQYGVYETALTDPGQIIYSAKFFKPSIGVITNIGIDHLSGCRTLENYILAKGEMLAALENKGTLIINIDDENIYQLDLSGFKGKIYSFGIKNRADFYATDIKYSEETTIFTLIFKSNRYKVTLPVIGEHNVYNALGAIAVIYALGLPIEEGIKNLLDFKPVRAHLERYKGLNDSVIIDDTWSSNPTSVEAAFSALSSSNATKVAVLGNISYLGDYVLEQCKNIASMVIKYNIDYLVAIDNFSETIAEEAVKLGMDKDKVFICKSSEDLNNALTKLLQPGVLVLFKTSMFDRKIKNIIKQYIKEGNDR